MTSRPAIRKSRNGCMQCKTRKIKCDETRPECKRCQIRNIQCPGYERLIRWSSKHQPQDETPKLAERIEDPVARSVDIIGQDGPSHLDQINNLSTNGILTKTAAPTRVSTESRSNLDVFEEWDPWVEFHLKSPHAFEEPFFEDWPSLLQDDAYAFKAQQVPAPSNCSNIEDVQPFAHTIQSQPSPDEYGDGGSTSQLPQYDQGVGIENSRPIQTSALVQPRFLANTPSVLCSYFFQEIIPLYCVWDNKSNWMRTVTESNWQFSATLYHTMQSMAAACLAASFPHLKRVARSQYALALNHLQQENKTRAAEDSTALSGFLLGHTACWHSPQDLAVQRFRSLRSMVKTWAASGQQQSTISFVDEALGYWRMLLAFLTEDSSLDRDCTMFTIGPTPLKQKMLPHPFSGISGNVVEIVADVGVLVFQQRKLMSNLYYVRERDMQLFHHGIAEARRLERDLLAYSRDSTNSMTDPGDPRTSLEDFERVDEAYRCTALLQLYRVFPDLLTDRYRPFNNSEILLIQPPIKDPTDQERNTWLTKFAMFILSLLRQIPFESGTRCMQPFIYVAVSSELRVECKTPNKQNLIDDEEICQGLDSTQIEISRARQFILSRLAAYEQVFPLPKVKGVMQLVKSIWSELDDGKAEVYWVDVARHENLGTMMG